MSELYKRYVDVIIRMQRDGKMIPLKLVWDNGIEYEIDKILSVEKHASEVGGGGTRYAVMICGKRRNLFYERDRWFIEAVHP